MKHDADDCKRVFAQLSEYLDVELPPEACGQIDEHLADCPPCVEFVESLRKTVELCRSYEPSVAPRPLTEKAREELRKAWEKMQAGRSAAGAPPLV